MNYIGATEGVPVPKVPYARAGKATWVVCGCGHKGRPGAFHICVDLSEPEPKPKPVPVARPKPKKRSRVAEESKPKRVKAPAPLCADDCGAEVSKAGVQCRRCYNASRSAARPARVKVGAGTGGGRGNKGGTVRDRLDEVARRYLAGESIRSLADDLDVTPNGIRLGLKRHGVAIRSAAEEHRGVPRPERRALTDEQAEEVGRKYVAGASQDELAERFSVGHTTIRNTLRRLGIPSRPAARRGRAA
jgi:hypothetical protein